MQKITENLNVHQGMPDQPSDAGYTGPTLKQKYDEPVNTIKTRFNALIDTLASAVSGNSGADKIGASVTGVLGNTVKAVLQALQDSKADASATTSALGLKADKVYTYTKSQTDAAINQKVVEIGAGDMAKAIYDPQGIGKDIYTAFGNPNLLINADFRKPVNQRGQTTYNPSNNQYTVDRWAAEANGNLEVLVLSDGIKLTNKGTSNFNFKQVLEGKLEVGQPFTFSTFVKEYSGRVTMNFGQMTSPYQGFGKDITNVGFSSINWTVTSGYSGYYRVSYGITPGSSVYLQWAKLEEGSVATPFVPRLYGKELALCQRYYLPLAPSTRFINCGIAPNTADFIVPTPSTLRVIPSVGGEIIINNFSNGALVTGFTYAAAIISGGCVMIRATKTGHGLTMAQLYVGSTGAYFDAEIY